MLEFVQGTESANRRHILGLKLPRGLVYINNKRQDMIFLSTIVGTIAETTSFRQQVLPAVEACRVYL